MIKVLTILPALSMGGAEHMAYELIKNMDKNEFKTKVICYGSKKNTPLEEKIEKVTEVEYIGIRGSITIFDFLLVFRSISSFEPDIIHAHMGGVTFAVPWCRLRKTPLVLSIHTRPDKAFSKRNQRNIKYFSKLNLLTVVAVSEENYKLAKEYYNLSDDKISFINNGVDIDRFYRKDHNGFAFINVARQDENKNQSIILKCFKRLLSYNDNLTLYLVGNGPCHEQLIQMTKEYCITDKVVLPGITSTPEQYYSVSDAYVQSSHREALPLSVLEAMATGIPIISTDVGGLRDVVKYNGFLVEDNNEDCLYNSMETILGEFLEKRDIYEKRCFKSKELVENYSSRKMSEEFENVYRRIIR